MDWFLHHWQSLAVILVVTATALVFVRRLLRRSGGAQCGGGCGCADATGSTKQGRTSSTHP